jgi:hypothetical protein
VSKSYVIKTVCRICSEIGTQKSELEVVLDLGNMALTSVFLEDGSDVLLAPLVLCRCKKCGLVQLQHTYSLESLYGEWYGYESHLNIAMVNHLQGKAKTLEARFYLNQEDIVVDIASNDGTLLAGYTRGGLQLIGIDPLINVVKDCYPDDATRIVDFFTDERYLEEITSPASLVTSLSVLYDLDSPITFAKDVANILKKDGIWHFEQSYLPSMVNTLSYDTICHEHLLYLTLHNIKDILDASGMQLLDATLNDVNGGSIAVSAIKTDQQITASPFVEFLLKNEISEGYVDGSRLRKFSADVLEHRQMLSELLSKYQDQGFRIVGLGASTKGNVLLQALKLSSKTIEKIGDVNPRKFGLETPGSQIPIVDETEVLAEADDKTLVIVLPWHFRAGMLMRSRPILEKGAQILFPLPKIEVVGI